MGRTPRSLMLNFLAVAALAAPGSIVSIALFAGEAHAQAGAFAEPVIDLLPSGDVVGDGSTAVNLQFIALNVDGSPMTGLSSKLSASQGNTSAVTELRPGLYRATWTPPKVETGKVLEVTLKGKTAAKGSFSKSWSVTAQPSTARALTISANPPQLVLGQDSTATVAINLSGDANAAATQGDVVLQSSSGSISNLTPLGQGRYSALYTAPNQQFPQVALVTVADRRDPTRAYGVLAIPLVGKASFPVTGLPNSRILVKVGDREFGPLQADASGRAQVPIVVPPGVQQAFVTSITADKKTEEPLDLQIPGAQRVKLFPLHQSVPADPAQGVVVRAYVASASGVPDTAARVVFSSTGGVTSPARHEGNGVYAANFTPPMSVSGGQVTIQVAVEDSKGKQADSFNLNLVAARPGSVTLTAEPASLSPSAQGFSLFAKVVGSDGVGMSGRELTFAVNGAKVNGKTKDLGNGDYQTAFTTTGNGPVEVVATVKAPASGNPLRRVLVFASHPSIPNDGLSSTLVTVLTLDEFGYPVAGVPVALQVAQGDAGLPTSLTTDDSGIGQVTLTAGRGAGVVRIQATAAGQGGATAVLQSPVPVAQDLVASASGSAATQDLSLGWRRIVTELRVGREGGGTIVAAPASVAAGPLARFALSSDPKEVPAGGSTTLKIRAEDSNGKGVAGQKLDFLASAGTIGSAIDLGNGDYAASLSVPAGTTGEVKVSVANADGTVAGMVKVPVGGAVAVAGGAWGTPVATAIPAAPTPTATPSAVTTPEPPKAPKPPREPGKYPWLRAGVGYLGGMYSYQQRSEALNGPIFKQNVTVGGGEGRSPAGASGFQLGARVWLPMFTYVGAEATFRTSRWSIDLSEAGYTDGEIPDFVNDVRLVGLIRYPFDVGAASQVSVAGRFGYDISDSIVFKQEGTDLVYENLISSGLLAGAEVDAEIGEHVFGTLGGEVNVKDYLLGAGWDFKVGYAFVDNWYVAGNAGLKARFVDVYSTPDNGGDKRLVGSIDDGLTMFGLTVGYQR